MMALHEHANTQTSSFTHGLEITALMNPTNRPNEI